MAFGFMPEVGLTFGEATFLRKVAQLAERVRDEGERLKRQIDSNADRLDMLRVLETRAYVGSCGAFREILEIAPAIREPERPGEEWEALVDRAVEEENPNWIFTAMAVPPKKS
jgi:hypothetical protein